MCFNPFKKISLISLAFIFLLFHKVCFAQVSFPFEGEINNNNINVRPDSTIVSEVICKLNKGTRVDVISEAYGWYKIRLPKSVAVYIKKGLVYCINYKMDSQCQNGKVLKDRVNIRLHPNESSPIVGVADRNEVINILEDKGGWYKIEAIQNSFGWIHKEFINKITATINKTENTTLPLKPLEENITLKGIVKPYGKIFGRIATHKLISEDNKIFLLKGNKESLNALNNQKVKVIGKIIDSPKQKYPVIEIKIMEAMN